MDSLTVLSIVIPILVIVAFLIIRTLRSSAFRAETWY